MSIALSQSRVKQQASFALMKQIMTTAETNGSALVDMLQQANITNAPHPYLGGKVDIKA